MRMEQALMPPMVPQFGFTELLFATAAVVAVPAVSAEPSFFLTGALGVAAATVYRMQFWLKKAGVQWMLVRSDLLAFLSLMMITWGLCQTMNVYDSMAGAVGVGVGLIGIEPFRKLAERTFNKHAGDDDDQAPKEKPV